MGGKKKVDSEVVKVRMKLPLQAKCRELQEKDNYWKTEQFSTFLAQLCSIGADVMERRSFQEESETSIPRSRRITPHAANQR